MVTPKQTPPPHELLPVPPLSFEVSASAAQEAVEENMVTDRTAVIVAHPDDEILWGGGLLARYSGLDVICCSVPKSDPERVLCFFKAMKLLGQHPILLPFSELTMADLLPHLHYLALNDYDTIITHNPAGEYGHPQHKQLHAYIAEKFKGNIYCFGYGKGNVVVHLNPVEQRKKVAALLCYDNVSPVDDGLRKWDALIRQYHVDLDHEFYTRFAVKQVASAFLHEQEAI